MSKWVVLVSMVVLAAGLSGCGVNGQSPAADTPSGDLSPGPHQGRAGGSVSMTVKFPDPGEASTRLIPVRTQSVEFYFVNEAQDVLYWDYATPDSPTVTISGLPEALAGYILAIAYPEAPATTAARGAVARGLELPPIYGCLAYAWTDVVVPAAGDSVNIPLTLDSAIRTLRCDPAELVLDIGSTLYPFISAWSEWDDLVIIEPSLLVWEVLSETPDAGATTTGVVDVAPDGTVTGLGYGTAEIQVTESESGVSATVLVTVAQGGAGLSLSGYVGDAADPRTPVPGVVVRLIPDDTTLTPVDGETDADGYFYIGDVPPGPATLTVITPASSVYAGWRHPFTVPEDRSPWLDLLVVPQRIEDAVANVAVEPADATWAPGDWVLYTATVTDSSGVVVNVTPMWFARGDAGVIDRDGWFNASAAGGDGEIVAIVGTHLGSTTVTVPSEGPPPGAIAGLVVDALDPSIPIADVTVDIEHLDPAAAAARSAIGPRAASRPVSTRNFVTVTTDEFGEFASDAILAGPNRLWITPPASSSYASFYVDMDVPPAAGTAAYIQVTMVTQSLADALKWIDVQPYGDDLTPVSVAVGDTLQFTATVYDLNDTVVDLALTWATFGPIGAVDPQGFFSARPDLGDRASELGYVSAQAGPAYGDSAVEVTTAAAAAAAP